MARPKAVQPSSVEVTINNKLAEIKSAITDLQTQQKHWEKVASDYETNKVTIESILSVHQVPDLSAPKAVRKGKVPRITNIPSAK